MYTDAAKSFDDDYKKLRRLYFTEDNAINKKSLKDWIKFRGALTLCEVIKEVNINVKKAKYIRQFKRQSGYELAELALIRSLEDE